MCGDFMSLNFVPDYRLNSFDELTVEFLRREGFCGVILDIDNTLEPYEHNVPGDRVKAWLADLEKNGIKVAFVSNNKQERVDTFNAELKLPAYHYSCKPFKKNLIRAMADIGTDKTNTVLMGDQIFTDVWGAHNAGIKAVLVPPINDKKDFITKFKRKLEKPFLRKFEKRKRRGEQG